MITFNENYKKPFFKQYNYISPDKIELSDCPFFCVMDGLYSYNPETTVEHSKLYIYKILNKNNKMSRNNIINIFDENIKGEYALNIDNKFKLLDLDVMYFDNKYACLKTIEYNYRFKNKSGKINYKLKCKKTKYYKFDSAIDLFSFVNNLSINTEKVIKNMFKKYNIDINISNSHISNIKKLNIDLTNFKN